MKTLASAMVLTVTVLVAGSAHAEPSTTVTNGAFTTEYIGETEGWERFDRVLRWFVLSDATVLVSGGRTNFTGGASPAGRSPLPDRIADQNVWEVRVGYEDKQILRQLLEVTGVLGHVDPEDAAAVDALKRVTQGVVIVENDPPCGSALCRALRNDHAQRLLLDAVTVDANVGYGKTFEEGVFEDEMMMFQDVERISDGDTWEVSAQYTVSLTDLYDGGRSLGTTLREALAGE